jgi:hypothetical protein
MQCASTFNEVRRAAYVEGVRQAPMIFILLIPYVAAAIMALADVRGRFAVRRIPTPALSPGAWVWILTIAYAAQLFVTWWAAGHQSPERMPYSQLPLPVLDWHTQHTGVVSGAIVVLGALQTYALLALYRANLSRVALAVGFAALAALSLAMPAFASFDPYGYVHDAALGRGAWTPPPVLTGEAGLLDRWLGKPVPAFYGPLWIPIVQLATGAASSLLGKLMLLRVFGLGLLLALLALMRGLGIPRRAIAIAALNPGLMFEFVANAHNDLIPIVILAMAACVVRRHHLLATALIVVAGTIKIPYALVGLPVLASILPAMKRYVLCVVAIVAAAAITLLGAGKPYLNALLHQAGRHGPWSLWHAPVVVLALVFLALAIAGYRRYRAAVWLFPALGAFSLPFIYPWYLIWAFPYALGRRAVLVHLLLGFPLAIALTQHELTTVLTLFIAFPLVTAILCLPSRALSGRRTAAI